jgi:hypothetical protein
MKKQIWVALFAVLSLGLASVRAAEKGEERPSDAEIRRKLVGNWHIEVVKTNISGSSSDTFESNGTFKSAAEFSAGQPAAHISISVEGTWEVKDGVLKETVTKSSNAQFPPVGLVTKDKVLRMDDKEFVYEDERGEIHTNKRVK